ncbi:MAG: hypothetical protein F6K55_26010 [Moorea sp. SIO4A3]|nr:hypothetical protein [Moorena sp. SIO4A3]
MAQNFVPNPGDNPNQPSVPNPSGEGQRRREQIKHILIGSPQAVRNTISTLYALGYGQVNDWSTPQPTENPGEVISILIRYVLLD